MLNTKHIQELIKQGRDRPDQGRDGAKPRPGLADLRAGAVQALPATGRISLDEAMANADSPTNLHWLINNATKTAAPRRRLTPRHRRLRRRAVRGNARAGRPLQHQAQPGCARLSAARSAPRSRSFGRRCATSCAGSKAARLSYGHGTTNARDEAAWLVPACAEPAARRARAASRRG